MNEVRLLEILMELGYGTVTSLEHLELDSIKSWLEQEKLSHIKDIKLIIEALDLISEYEKEQNDRFVKIRCYDCLGSGYRIQDRKKLLCDTCHGKGYVWAERFEK